MTDPRTPQPIYYIGPVLIGNGTAVCMRCTDSTLDGDDPQAWANWHARRGCINFTGFTG